MQHPESVIAVSYGIHLSSDRDMEFLVHTQNKIKSFSHGQIENYLKDITENQCATFSLSACEDWGKDPCWVAESTEMLCAVREKIRGRLWRKAWSCLQLYDLDGLPQTYPERLCEIFVSTKKEVWGNSVHPHIKKVYLIARTVFWFQEQVKGKKGQSCLEIPWESD